MKFNINIDSIDSKNKNIAYKYNEYQDVDHLTINQKDGYHVEAKLSIFDRIQNCSFDIKDQKLVSYDCSCPFCNSKTPCGHIGAAILLLNRLEIDTFPYEYTSEKSQTLKQQEEAREKAKRRAELEHLAYYSHQLLNYSKNEYQKELSLIIQNEKYELIPIFSTHNEYPLTVEYKIGNDKKYVIKNLPDFIERIDQKENYKYGKTLEFVHTLDNFSKQAQKQIAFIKACIEHFNEVHQNDYNPPRITRYVPISNDQLDQLYEINQDLPEFGEFNTEIELNTQQDDECYTLSLILNQELILGKKHAYMFDENPDFFIKRMTFDEQGNTTRFIEAVMKSKNQLIVTAETYPDFYKYVLAPILPYFTVHDDTTLDIPTYDEIKIYGDIDDQNEIYFQVIYIDENQNQVYGFNKEMMTTYEQDLVENYIEHYASFIDYDHHRAYFDINESKTYEFIYEGLEVLKEYGDIFVSQALKRIGDKASYQVHVGVSIKNNLLEFDISSHEIPKSELQDVLNQYRRKKKFYKLKNGEVLYLDSPDLEELSTFMDDYHVDIKDINNGKFEMNKQRMLSIDEETDDFKYVTLDREKSFTDTITKFKSVTQQTYQVPKSYQTILRDYQKEGYAWLHTLKDYGFNGILADDMGLGKTLQVITLLESLKTDLPSIVVCPSSLIYNWQDEVHKFSNQLKVTCITGDSQVRKSIIQQIHQGLYVTSYDYMRRDYELYQGQAFEYVILDEAQYIKNQKTKNAQSVKTLNAKHKLALTGTPIENSLAELWSIFDFLMPQYLFNYHYFQKQYENDIVKNQNEEKTAQLKKLVSPFILRRNKKDVLTELPDKIEQNMILPFNNEEEKLYVANLSKVNEELQQLYDIEGSDKMQILKMLTRLRQLCLEPRLVYDNIDQPSSKLKATLELLNTFHENHQKVLLFSSFTTALDLIKEECQKAGISYYVLTGSTKKETRKELVSRFQKDDTTVFLISLKAGGTGLNLTAAQAVIHYDPWWNVSAQNQATDRAYRIGQKNNVQVFNMVMKDSVEEKIIELQKRKKELADAFVENNSGSLSQMSKEDILSLFKM